MVLFQNRPKAAPHIPVYQVASTLLAVPDHVGENSDLTQHVREHWFPIFEKYGVQVAFEHHDHAYKRTKPMLAGKINPKGITYLGDGARGVCDSAERAGIC